MGSNASKPPAPASRLSNEEMQELVGRLVSMLPAPPMAPPPEVVPEPVFPNVAPVPTPPQAAPDASTATDGTAAPDASTPTDATPASPAMPGDGSEPEAYVRVCEHCGHMSYFRNGVCFNPHCVTCLHIDFFLQFYFFLAPVEAFVAPFFS